MNYIYDIYLNFNKELYDFFEWNKNDKLIHIKMIPIFKTSEEIIRNIINYNIKLDEKYWVNLKEKATIWNKSNEKKSYILFCDENNVIAVEFDREGKSINKSSLLITEELEVLETTYKIKSEAGQSYFGNINYLKETLATLLEDKWKIFIYAESENQALRINELLLDFEGQLNILPLPISAGFGLPEKKLLVIQENEIFGRRKHVPRSVKHAKSAVIDTFVELNPGDYVVHVNQSACNALM